MNHVEVISECIQELMKKPIDITPYITNRSTFSEVGFTSLMFVQFLVRIEEKLEIELNDSVLQAALRNTIGGFIMSVDETLKKKG